MQTFPVVTFTLVLIIEVKVFRAVTLSRKLVEKLHRDFWSIPNKWGGKQTFYWYIQCQCICNLSSHLTSSVLLLQECIQICRPDLTTEVPVIPSDGLLQPLSPLDPESLSSLSLLPSSSPQVKRSYSMEHFRWGKPVGRKRRPNKLFTSNGVEEESAEDLPEEMSRRGAEDKQQEKKDSTYKMKHFRWSGPPASKRNNGFMKSRDEGRPLLALFKNGVIQDGQEQKMEQWGGRGGQSWAR